MDSVRVSPKLDPRFVLLPVIIVSAIFLVYLLVTPPSEKEQTTVSTTTTTTPAPSNNKEEDEIKGGIAGTIEGPVVVSIMPLNESNASSVSNPTNSSK